MECDDCGFLYQYAVSVTELQGLLAAMFSVLLDLSNTYTCAYTYIHKHSHKYTLGIQTQAEDKFYLPPFVSLFFFRKGRAALWLNSMFLGLCQAELLAEIINNLMDEDIVLAVWA